MHSRYVLSWRVSTSLDTRFCLDALNEAIQKYGFPEMSNTDQGCQFTSKLGVEILLAGGVRVSMDGRGRCFDNIFVERLWRTVKYEDVYLKRYESIRALKAGLTDYFRHYNERRIQQALDYQTPQQVYLTGIERKALHRAAAPWGQTLRSLEPLSNTQNNDEMMVLDSTLA